MILQDTEEQLDALVVSFYPVIQDFFSSEMGKMLYEEYLKKKNSENKSVA